MAFDAAGTAERAPDGAEQAKSVAEVAQRSDFVLLRLPDGGIVLAVPSEVAGGRLLGDLGLHASGVEIGGGES